LRYGKLPRFINLNLPSAYPPPRCTRASASDRLRRSGHHGHPDMDLAPQAKPCPSPATTASAAGTFALAPCANGQPLMASMQRTAPAPRAPVPLFRPQERNPEDVVTPRVVITISLDIFTIFQKYSVLA
jgi:hypothetical protein